MPFFDICKCCDSDEELGMSNICFICKSYICRDCISYTTEEIICFDCFEKYPGEIDIRIDEVILSNV